MESTIVRRVKHTPPWRRLLSITLVLVGTASLVFRDPGVAEWAGVLLIVAGILVFLPREYFTLTYAPDIHTLTLVYRGKRVTVPTENVNLLVFEYDGNEGVIALNYADGTSRRVWEGPRLGNVAEAVRDMLDIDYDLRLY